MMHSETRQSAAREHGLTEVKASAASAAREHGLTDVTASAVRDRQLLLDSDARYIRGIFLGKTVLT